MRVSIPFLRTSDRHLERFILSAVATLIVAATATQSGAGEPPRPHVVIVMIDALRPDHLGAWGKPELRTPHLDRVAEQGVFFRNIFAPMPSSAPSRATILTGRAPHTHGVRINGRNLPLAELTLTELLADNGYTTVSTGRLQRQFDQGFEHVNIGGGELADSLAGVMWDSLKYGEAEDGLVAADVAPDVRAAIKWMATHGHDEAPTFLWLDMTHNLHEPWRPPPPYDTMFDADYTGRDVSVNPMYSPDLTEREVQHAHALYDGQASFVDSQFGWFTKALTELGLSERTILVVVSDHGTYLGEHDLWQKCPVMFDPVMRSTLIIRQNGVVSAGVQIEHLAQLSDVFATILDLAELPVPGRAAGSSHSLRSTWESKTSVRPAVFMEFCRYKGTASKAIRSADWLYVYFESAGETRWGEISPADVLRAKDWPRRMLFDVKADPDLTANLVDAHPEVEGQLRSQLLDWLIASENDLDSR